MRNILFLLLAAGPGLAQSPADLSTRSPVPAGQPIAIGFLGAIEKWNDPQRSVRKLALDLRAQGIAAETFENRHEKTAVEFLRRALDTNGDGRLDDRERAQARVILYGQSLGGEAAVHTARDLRKLRIPVLLTVQIDSVGMHGGKIPSNVHEAINYYQHDPLTIQGRREIHAEDPARTRILGNFERSYRGEAPQNRQATWIRRTFGGSHAKMEMDLELWAEIRGLILDAVRK
ncbi:MAG: hypothetical protein ABI823_05520 [Bryobacteraceae bacterium]